MRTTVILPDELYRQVKKRAREEDRTVTSLMEDALRRELARRDSHGPVDIHLSEPTGTRDDRPLIDVADKDAVQELLDDDDFTVQEIRRAQAGKG